MHVYLIPGMGCTERLFDGINLSPFSQSVIRFETAGKGEALSDCATRLSEKIDTTKPFALLGVSMGGMLAMEMTKVLDPALVILISSARNSKELPRRARWWRYFPIYRIVPAAILRWAALRCEPMMGIRSKEHKLLFRNMLKEIDARWLKASIHMVVNWRGSPAFDRVVQIHGTRDKVLPHRYITDCTSIRGGSHLMGLNRQDKIVSWTLEQLRSMAPPA